MQQIVFTREFSVLFDAVKTVNAEYLEKKSPLKDCYRKNPEINPEKKSHKILILRNLDRFSIKSLRGVRTPYLGYLLNKYGINRSFRFGISLYADRRTDSPTNSLFYHH